MPGIGELIEGAMQQAPQPERQLVNDMNVALLWTRHDQGAVLSTGEQQLSI
ncbi:MAG: hypothetical protein ACJARL_002506 [Halopseudomonas sp.]|jgi:hypothetical protein|tara:strand:+ start:1038 stop:1190 length:153 start_codon:yes stop_codon:yes gene_type:complete